MSRFVDIRRQLHQIPEPGFQEVKTQALLLDVLATFACTRLQVKTWRTGILAHIAGSNPKQRIGYRSDMDGLPIPEETGLPFASNHAGFMHACGHDVHMSIALGVIAHFVNHEIDDDVLVIFQPAEEGPGGALPMRASEEFSSWRPDCIFALHVAPEYPAGTIATKSGILFANTSELFIDLLGTGGHAAYPHRANDMVVAAAHLVTQLQTIVARNVDPLESVVVTIGKIEGGTRQNVIAERARLEGTIRTLAPNAMDNVKTRIEHIVHGIETSFDCVANIDYGSNYRQVWNNAAWTERFTAYIEDTDAAHLVTCTEAMTGEDFGYFLEDIPGIMFWLGVNTPYGLHHAKLSPDEAAIEVAIRLLTGFITDISVSP